MAWHLSGLTNGRPLEDAARLKKYCKMMNGKGFLTIEAALLGTDLAMEGEKTHADRIWHSQSTVGISTLRARSCCQG
jgi:hypothetical protein